MRRLALLAAATGLIAAGTVIAQPMPPGPPPGSPSGPPGPGMVAMPTPDYVSHAARTDMFEIAEARMALHHSQNPHVRQFAQMMIADHTKSTNMIKAALRRSGHNPPPPPMLGPEQQRLMDELRASGPNFDRTYIDQQVQGHQKALQLHQAYANGGDDPALRHTARMIVPVVQHHLAMAQDIQGHIG